MAKIVFEPSGDEETVEDGSRIQEICEEAGVPFACTEGVCGTCVIEVLEGMENISEPSQEEKDFLGDDCTEERLACQCKLKSGTIKINF